MIYIYCEKDTLKFFIDYINSLISNYSNLITLVNDVNLFYNNDKCDSTIIFIQKIPSEFNAIRSNNDNVFLLNTEQLSKENTKTFIQNLHSKINIIDYSLANIKIINNLQNKIYYLPYLINSTEIFNYDKTNDIAIIGDWNSAYRLNIKNNLENRTKINLIEGFDNERDLILFKHKILLNVHYDESYKIFEQMRCNRCILNKMIVITEKSLDTDFELKEYIIECDYDNLIETTIDVLKNYDYYYNKLFKDFDIEKISKKYKLIGDKFFTPFLT
jgi:hypothetical protein